MDRRALALVALFALVASAGCTGLFGSESVDREALSANATYDWNKSVDGYVVVERNNYTAVYDVADKATGDNGTIELYERDALGTEKPLSVSALQFRYENGTRIRYVDGEAVRVAPNGSTRPTDALSVSTTRKRTVVELPADEGKLAFTAPKNGKRVSSPTFVDGSMEMVLPENARVGVPLLAQVQPSADDTTLRDGRVHVSWRDVSRSPSVVVRYYLERDLLIFGTLVGAMVVLGIAGGAYYYLQIRETVRRREEVGLDVEDEG